DGHGPPGDRAMPMLETARPHRTLRRPATRRTLPPCTAAFPAPHVSPGTPRTRPMTPWRRRLPTTPAAAPSRGRVRSRAITFTAALFALAQLAAPAHAQRPLRIFISVDM